MAQTKQLLTNSIVALFASSSVMAGDLTIATVNNGHMIEPQWKLLSKLVVLGCETEFATAT